MVVLLGLYGGFPKGVASGKGLALTAIAKSKKAKTKESFIGV